MMTRSTPCRNYCFGCSNDSAQEDWSGATHRANTWLSDAASPSYACSHRPLVGFVQLGYRPTRCHLKAGAKRMSIRSGLALSTLALLFALFGYGLFGIEGATAALAVGCFGIAFDLWSSRRLPERLGAQEITDTKFIWWTRALADRVGV